MTFTVRHGIDGPFIDGLPNLKMVIFYGYAAMLVITRWESKFQGGKLMNLDLSFEATLTFFSSKPQAPKIPSLGWEPQFLYIAP